MTRIQSSRVSIPLFTPAGSAFAGYFAAPSASPRLLSNAVPCALASGPVASYDGITVVPTRTCASRPAGPASFEYGTPFRTSADFATSHGEVNFDVPTGLNCTEQFAGSATTVTGAAASAASSAGLA